VNDGGSEERIHHEPPVDLDDQLEQTGRSTQQRQLNSQINSALREILRSLNDRDVDLVRERLDAVHEMLGTETELERLLFGGSVARHTYVDGLSDIDALVVLDREDARGMDPGELLDSFRDVLLRNLAGADIRDISSGRLAVTVTYRDGMEIQLLPAIRVGSKLAIRGEGQKKWTAIDPGAFRAQLTDANKRLGNQLVPAVKLIKSMMAGFPSQKQMTGYHIEALSLAAVRDYTGPATLSHIIPCILERGAELVMRSIRDVTGQSRSVDAYLGQAGSLERRIVADGLQTAARQLKSAGTYAEWVDLIGG
jgi:predicted nucleotidyltransferase